MRAYGKFSSYKVYPLSFLILLTFYDDSKSNFWEACVKARKRQENGEFSAEINFQQMDAHVLEFEENQFDHTVVAHTLAVVAEPEVVLREIMRVTKPSGLIVIVNHYKDKKGILGTIWNPFRKRLGLGKHVDFKSLITKCGLDLVSEERVNRFTTHSRMLVCKSP